MYTHLKTLKTTDKKMYDLIQEEVKRQKQTISLIASENYVSEAVLEALGTPLTNKYAEGYPQKRYYAGNAVIDEIESLAIARAKKIFKSEHANVQPHAGSQANTAVYLALLKAHDKVLGVDLSSGGHLTHGSPVNISGMFYEFHTYGVDKKTEQLDYEEIARIARKIKPKLIICGATAYSREIDFKKFRVIADTVGAYLMADIAHIAGLVAAGVHPHPFPHCDVVTATTHKTLRGARGGLILCKKTDRFDTKHPNLANKIDRAVFPGVQGGPLEHVIAAKAIGFGEVMRPAFKTYAKQIIKNAQAMAKQFGKDGIRVVSGGTDNHLLLLDIASYTESAQAVQKHLEDAGIVTNRNTIPFDQRTPFDPSGVRLGTAALTTRGLKEKEAELLAQLIARIIKNPSDANKKAARKEVRALAKRFPVPM